MAIPLPTNPSSMTPLSSTPPTPTATPITLIFSHDHSLCNPSTPTPTATPSNHIGAPYTPNGAACPVPLRQPIYLAIRHTFSPLVASPLTYILLNPTSIEAEYPLVKAYANIYIRLIAPEYSGLTPQISMGDDISSLSNDIYRLVNISRGTARGVPG